MGAIALYHPLSLRDLFVSPGFLIRTFDLAKLLSEIAKPLQTGLEFSVQVNSEFQRSYFVCHGKFTSIFIVAFQFSIILSLLKFYA